MPKKINPEELDFSPSMFSEPRLGTIKVCNIQVNPDKMYAKKAGLNQAEINKQLLVSEAKKITKEWGGFDKFKAAFNLAENMKQFFKDGFDLDTGIMKIIHQAELLLGTFKQQPTAPEARSKLDQVRNLFETILNGPDILKSSGIFIREILGKYESLHRIENNINSLIEDIGNDLIELITACESNKIIGNPGKPKGLFGVLFPEIFELWAKGSKHEARCARNDDNPGGYKGKFFDFILMLNQLLKIRNPDLSLGTKSTIGKETSHFLSITKK